MPELHNADGLVTTFGNGLGINTVFEQLVKFIITEADCGGIFTVGGKKDFVDSADQAGRQDHG